MGTDDKRASGPPKFQLYNSETGELLGRNGASWLKITIFYIAYFTFLAGLFMASISIMKTTINDDKPKLQTRLNIPGLHALPKFNPTNKVHTDRLSANDATPIAYNVDGDADSNGDIYATMLDEIKATYTDDAGDNEKFDVSTLGVCGTGKYGYDTTEPCVWLRLNKVIDWEPVGFFAPTGENGFTGDSLAAAMERDAVYMRCESKLVSDSTTDVLTFDYFGGANNDGNFEKKFYPFTGKKFMPKYQQPIVAVKVKGMLAGELYRVYCRAFARNIPTNDRDNLGSITFEMKQGTKED